MCDLNRSTDCIFLKIFHFLDTNYFLLAVAYASIRLLPSTFLASTFCLFSSSPLFAIYTFPISVAISTTNDVSNASIS